MEEAQIEEILIRSGVMTVNEVRRRRGLAEFANQESVVSGR